MTFLLAENGGEILFTVLDSAYLFLSVQSCQTNILLVSDTYLLNFQKQRTLLPEEDPMKDPQLQEYVKKMNAYFKEVDEFELEVESGDDLD